jgi:hypothetical protein
VESGFRRSVNVRSAELEAPRRIICPLVAYGLFSGRFYCEARWARHKICGGSPASAAWSGFWERWLVAEGPQRHAQANQQHPRGGKTVWPESSG